MPFLVKPALQMGIVSHNNGKGTMNTTPNTSWSSHGKKGKARIQSCKNAILVLQGLIYLGPLGTERGPEVSTNYLGRGMPQASNVGDMGVLEDTRDRSELWVSSRTPDN